MAPLVGAGVTLSPNAVLAGLGNESFSEELIQRLDRTEAANPDIPRHRDRFPWLTGCLGDPSAPVWFIAENPSLTQVEKIDSDTATVESQWAASRGDILFRQMLVKHGFKLGTELSPGGWRCYITDVIKSADRVTAHNAKTDDDREQLAAAWGDVLRWEFESGRPRLVVTVGGRARDLLSYVAQCQDLPLPEAREHIVHYTYVMSFAQGRLGPGHPERIRAWDAGFAAIAKRAAALR